MRSTSVILRPVVSEKAFRLATGNQYTFVVDRRATAPDVTHAIETLYKVDVTGVRTSTVAGKRTRYRGHAGQRVSWKRAVVSVKAGQRIEGFEVAEEGAKVSEGRVLGNETNPSTRSGTDADQKGHR